MKLKKCFIIISVFFVLFMIFILVGMHQLNDVKWKSDKNYYSFVVRDEDVADYNVFLSPSDEYEKLNAIDINTRTKIAEYMKENSLCLAKGEQSFDRIDYTYEELVYEYFRFKPCDKLRSR